MLLNHAPSKLERAILDWIAARQPSLAARLSVATIVKREYTGAGFFVDLLSKDFDADWDRPAVDGPLIDSPLLDFGGGSILYLLLGEPCCLEIYAFGDHFPEHLDEFELSTPRWVVDWRQRAQPPDAEP